MTGFERPGAGDHAPYYGGYIELVEDGDILEILTREGARTSELLDGVSAESETYRYAPGKWSVREVVGHLIDTERVFAYRALSFARGDAGPLPGMDQVQWNDLSEAHAVSLAALVAEYRAVRASSVAQFGRMSSEHRARRGVASGVEFAVRSFPWIIAGHELHHRRILTERYGVAGGGA